MMQDLPARPHLADSASLMKTRPYRDPVIEAYMPGVDRTLLRENLKLTHEQRLQKLISFSAFAAELRRAGRRAPKRKKNK